MAGLYCEKYINIIYYIYASTYVLCLLPLLMRLELCNIISQLACSLSSSPFFALSVVVLDLLLYFFFSYFLSLHFIYFNDLAGCFVGIFFFFGKNSTLATHKQWSNNVKKAITATTTQVKSVEKYLRVGEDRHFWQIFRQIIGNGVRVWEHRNTLYEYVFKCAKKYSFKLCGKFSKTLFEMPLPRKFDFIKI